MGAVKAKKNKSKLRRKIYVKNQFDCIPKELLVEILARVALASHADLFNAQLSCKLFYETTLSEDYIFEHVTLDLYDVIASKNSYGAVSFLERCKNSGNPEMLFRQGMIEFFNADKPDSIALDQLKMATKKRHVKATYVYGNILVCYGGQFRQEGLKLLNSLGDTNSRCFVVKECRKKIVAVFKTMWRVTNYIVGKGPEDYNRTKACSNCNGESLRFLTIEGGEISYNVDEVQAMSCDSCFWDHEASLFHNIIMTGRFDS